jgi:hypothetical protein
MLVFLGLNLALGSICPKLSLNDCPVTVNEELNNNGQNREAIKSARTFFFISNPPLLQMKILT